MVVITGQVHAVHIGGGDGGDDVRGARPARHEADAGAPGHARVAVGHVGRALLAAVPTLLAAVRPDWGIAAPQWWYRALVFLVASCP